MLGVPAPVNLLQNICWTEQRLLQRIPQLKFEPQAEHVHMYISS